MFYSDAILARRGPLARVWLAAHMEKKLSKAQALQTDIEESVDIIMNERIEIMALRLSGQLLLGVARIYSRKAKYLLDDCNEALDKIKMTFFRPGVVVDMTAAQASVDKNAITLRPMALLDLLLPDVNWDWEYDDRLAQAPPYTYQASTAQVTLPLGPANGIASGDYSDVASSVGGARYQSEPVFEPFSGVGEQQRALSEVSPSFGGDVDEGMSIGIGRVGEGMDVPEFVFGGMEGVDLEGMGIGYGAQPPLSPLGLREEGEGEGSPPPEYGSSPVIPGLSPLPEITPSPRAAAPIALPPTAPVQPPVPGAAPAAKRKRREKPQIIDTIIERSPPDTRDVSDILTAPSFVPRSSITAKLLEIREDPLAHFLGAPVGLPPALSRMFTGVRGRSVTQQEMVAGLGVEEAEEEEEPGVGRRLSRVPSAPPFEPPSSPPAQFPPVSGFPLAPGQFEMGPPSYILEEPQTEDTFEFPEGPVDIGLPPMRRSPAAVSVSGVSMAPSVVVPESEVTGVEEFDVLGLLKTDLRSEEGDEEERVVNWNELVGKVKTSRHVAAVFFYQLLVLGTRDNVKLSQEVAYGDIEVRAKDGLWAQRDVGGRGRGSESVSGRSAVPSSPRSVHMQ
ncbi:hypothetical protein BDN72DRAFT_828138 [Pluteus cervinus]|uniref:Uncharacterized protein n=1 Tax=Pluteus cervinus TaxID=181527 RepID=A0ACD3A7E4_9AGAR|nr:hypothetical protein BDN72DRAFT_828138 [Pluteus cervinus]